MKNLYPSLKKSYKGLDMGTAQKFEKEKLIIGVIYHDKEILQKTLDILVDKFGEIEDVCEEFSFSREFSPYYDEELGGEGMRRIYSFKNTVDPEYQAEIKEFTNEIENSFQRRINLDPGFISTGRLLLATTKEIGFRIALKRGIYTELTLYWARGKWQKLPWTYRDYQSEKVQSFITKVRAKYIAERRALMHREGRTQKKSLRGSVKQH